MYILGMNKNSSFRFLVSYFYFRITAYLLHIKRKTMQCDTSRVKTFLIKKNLHDDQAR